MTYDYICDACEDTQELILPSSKRDEPLSDPCTKCGGAIRRVICMPSYSYETSRTTAANSAGSGWNDRLKEIKSTSARSNTIKVK
jgi:predicted nucleic acid-binding Zn ribbon protein